MKVAAIICVRMNSERLPGKALCVYDEASGKTNLECLIERVKTSRHNPRIVVATGVGEADAEIAKHAGDSCVLMSKQSNDNQVVALFDNALRTYVPDADYVWRVMADCPLVDVGLVDWRLDVLRRNKADVMIPVGEEPTYAAQASIWSRAAWDYCAKQSSGSLLQHPGEFIYENYGMFKRIPEPGPENVYYQDIRTELDTSEDLEFFRQIWRKCPGGQHSSPINTKQVLAWLKAYPEIVSINKSVAVKTKSTHLHGHHRARDFICQGCGNTLGVKINDALEVQCTKCGNNRRFYP